MADRVRFIEHKGVEILLIDFSGCSSADVIRVSDQVRLEVAQHPPNSILTLADYTSAQIDKAAATRIKEVLTMDRPFVKRSAWIGTESLPKVFYENFKSFSRREFPLFQTREEAMEWLVSGQ